MHVTRLYTGEDNESHFEDIDIPLPYEEPIGRLSDPIPVKNLIFRETSESYNYEWHNAPRRQFIIMLGDVEIEVGDGTKRILHAGDILLVEDTTGRGHISRAVNRKSRRSVFITLE